MAPRRAPILTILTLSCWAVGTVLYHLGVTGYWYAVRRDPHALADGQIWRVISPVLVQPDPGSAVIGLAFLCALIGFAAEQVFGRVRWAILFLAGGLAGHVIGEFWQPYSSGISVAFCGLLGGLAVYALTARLRGERLHPPHVAGSIVVLAAGAGLTAITDIHGPALLAGALVGVAFRGTRSGRATLR